MAGVHFSTGDDGIKQKTPSHPLQEMTFKELTFLLIFLLWTSYGEFRTKQSLESACSDFKVWCTYTSQHLRQQYRNGMLAREEGTMAAEEKPVTWCLVAPTDTLKSFAILISEGDFIRALSKHCSSAKVQE